MVLVSWSDQLFIKRAIEINGYNKLFMFNIYTRIINYNISPDVTMYETCYYSETLNKNLV